MRPANVRNPTNEPARPDERVALVPRGRSWILDAAGATQLLRLVATTIAICLVALLAPSLAHASQLSASEEVVVGSDEIVDESMIVAAANVRIDGTVDGDVMVTAQRVVISGVVRGNVDAMAEEVEIDGDVIGTLHCLCRELTLRGHVHENIDAAGQSIIVAASGRVSRDLLALGQHARIEGEVVRDVRFHGEGLDVVGTVGRDIAGAMGSLDASSGARVVGDIDVAVPHHDLVRVDPQASIGGQTRIEQREEMTESEYVQPGWYLLQLAQFVGAFIVGFVLVKLYPPILSTSFGGAKRLAISAGIGLLVLVLTPIAFGIAMLSVVGVPLGLIGLAIYLVALYVSGIVVGARLGHFLLRGRTDSILAALFVGLLILAVATALPYVGNLIAFVVIILGLGMLHRIAVGEVPKQQPAPTTAS